jgi:hypothetical protein
MNRRGLSLAVLVGAVLMGCGGTEAASSEEVLGRVSEALVTCTATCQDAPSVSCTGTTCSATQGSHVTCDGVTTACAQPPSECDGLEQCSTLHNDTCFGREQRACCNSDGFTQGVCRCSLGAWTCTL